MPSPSAAEKAAAVPGPLRYAGAGGGVAAGPMGAAGSQAGQMGGGGSGGGGAAKPAQSSAGLGMLLTALGPLAALMGKAIKDRASER